MCLGLFFLFFSFTGIGLNTYSILITSKQMPSVLNVFLVLLYGSFFPPPFFLFSLDFLLRKHFIFSTFLFIYFPFLYFFDIFAGKFSCLYVSLLLNCHFGNLTLYTSCFLFLVFLFHSILLLFYEHSFFSWLSKDIIIFIILIEVNPFCLSTLYIMVCIC